MAAEVALGLVLLIGAGLMVGTLAWLDALDPGFDTHNVSLPRRPCGFKLIDHGGGRTGIHCRPSTYCSASRSAVRRGGLA